MYLVQASCQQVVWSTMADPSACHCRHVQRNHSPKACGNQRHLSCEKQEKHPFGIEANIGDHFLSYSLCFFSLPYIFRLHFFPLSKLVSLSPLQFQSCWSEVGQRVKYGCFMSSRYMPALSSLLPPVFLVPLAEEVCSSCKDELIVPLIQVACVLKCIRTCSDSYISHWMLLWQFHDTLPTN